MKARKTTSSFFESGKDSAEAFEPSKQPLYFIAFLVEVAIVLPRSEPIGLGRNHRNHAQVENKLPGFIAFVCPIHQQAAGLRHLAQAPPAVPASRGIVIVTRRQAEDYCRSSIRGNQMNLGVPSATRFPDGLGPFFLKPRFRRVHLHRGRVQTEGFDLDAQNLLSAVTCSNTRSKTPFLAQRFMRT